MPDEYFVSTNWSKTCLWFQGLDQVVADLEAEGVYVTVYCNPHLIEGSEMFEEAAARGHLLLDENGDIYLVDFGGFYGGTVDLLDTDSSTWYRGNLFFCFQYLGQEICFE